VAKDVNGRRVPVLRELVRINYHQSCLLRHAPGVRVLLRVDESTYQPVRDSFKTRGGKPTGRDHPVAWVRARGGGRFFHTELGHDLRSLDTAFGRRHVTAGLR
jgi:hypothetical protein